MALLLIFSVFFLYCFPLLFMLGLNTFFRLFTVFFCPVFLIMAIWFISAVLRVVDSSLYFLSPHSSLPPPYCTGEVWCFYSPSLYSYIPPALLARVCLLEKENRFLSPYKWIIATMFWRGGGISLIHFTSVGENESVRERIWWWRGKCFIFGTKFSASMELVIGHRMVGPQYNYYHRGGGPV